MCRELLQMHSVACVNVCVIVKLYASVFIKLSLKCLHDSCASVMQISATYTNSQLVTY